MNKGSNKRKIASNLLLGLIFLLICGLYIMLTLTDQIPIIGLSALGGAWLLYGLLNGRLSPATPMDFPVLALLALLPLSLWVSVDKELSLTKIYGVILGVAVFYFIVNFLRNYQRLKLAVWGLILLGFGIALLGLLGTDWTTSRYADFLPSLEGLSALIPAIPRHPAGIHANAIGGSLAFLIPLYAGLLWDGGAYSRLYLVKEKFAVFHNIIFKLIK